MKNCSQKYKRLVGIKELYYRRVSAPAPWKTMLQDKYGIPQSKCLKKHKKGECWLFAESETEFDKFGNVRKSSRKVYNTQLHTEFSYHNVYDVHCRLVQWEMSMQQNGAETQFPQSVLLQPVKMFFNYNEYGDLASASDGEVESTFDYKYDENDNWTTRYQIVNGKCVEIIVRQFKYGEAEEIVAESDVESEPEDEPKSEEVIEDAEQPEDEMEEDKPEENEILETETEVLEEPDGDTIEEQVEVSSGVTETIVGKRVSHIKFGIGEIVSVEKTNEKQYIIVAFGRETKRFIYPDAFEHFMEWVN
ncbi:MAG: hypothetical protein K5860_02455 [Bacteroidales bacterium]|nr:hypothetical protein [Bacteroidales bacterium]